MFDPNYNALLFYWHTASWAFILAAILVFLYAQYKRRSPHPICRKCGYDLASVIRPDPQQATKLPTPPPTCPECGHASKKYCFKHRLKRRFVLLAVLLFLLSELLCIIPRAQRNGPIAFVPTWVLAVCAPHPRALKRWNERSLSDHISGQQYASMSDELHDRITHSDHNWLHVELLIQRHNPRWFSDVSNDRVMMAYAVNRQTSQSIALTVYEELELRGWMNQRDVVSMNWPSDFALISKKAHIIYADAQTHEMIKQFTLACEAPLDDKYTNVHVQRRIPSRIVALENTVYADHVDQSEPVITLQRLAEVIYQTTGLQIDSSSLKYALYDLKSANVKPSYETATLSELLDQITVHPWCSSSNWFRWHVVGSQIQLCDTKDVVYVDYAYDFRITTPNQRRSILGHQDEAKESSVLYHNVRGKLFDYGYHSGIPDYKCLQIHKRYLIHAPLHTHARIQRLLPILRAELTLAEQSRTP